MDVWPRQRNAESRALHASSSMPPKDRTGPGSGLSCMGHKGRAQGGKRTDVQARSQWGWLSNQSTVTHIPPCSLSEERQKYCSSIWGSTLTPMPRTGKHHPKQPSNPLSFQFCQYISPLPSIYFYPPTAYKCMTVTSTFTKLVFFLDCIVYGSIGMLH